MALEVKTSLCQNEHINEYHMDKCYLLSLKPFVISVYCFRIVHQIVCFVIIEKGEIVRARFAQVEQLIVLMITILL
jgi:hypothetical protein